MLGTLLDLARASDDPDAYLLDGRPFGPQLLVVHSHAALRAMAECPDLDKRLTANVAVAVTGELGAYEAVNGTATNPAFVRQAALLDANIQATQKRLREQVAARMAEHFERPCEFNYRQAQYFTASVILGQIFPAHRWTQAAIAETIDALEQNFEWIAPTIQAGALRGQGPEAILDDPGLAEVVARYEAIWGELVREERACAGTIEEPGMAVQLLDAGLSWPDTKALMSTFFAASYETVASTLTEWVYQVARAPELFEAMRAVKGEERRRLVAASVYESVRLIAPLAFVMRQAERDCVLEVVGDEGSVRSLAIEGGQLVIGLITAPLRDAAVFPKPGTMRLQLSAAQRDRIRLAWGLQCDVQGAAPSRFCRGFSYSIALMTLTIDALLDGGVVPRLVQDSPVQMFGTQARRDFVAQFD